MSNEQKKEILQRNTWWKSNQDQKDKDEDQHFLIFIRWVNDSLIFQWNGKTEEYLSLNKRKRKKGTAPRFLPEGDDYLAASLRGGELKETKIQLSLGCDMSVDWFPFLKHTSSFK